MQYLIILFRTFIFYVLIILVYRFMGKREVGQLSIIDLIVSILIAELVSISISNIKNSIFLSILPISLLVILQIVLASLEIKIPVIKDIIEGKPSIIIEKGKINFKEMLRQRYNLDDLLSQLREKDYKSIKDVEYAILETNGTLSTFAKDNKDEYPIALILDGNINEEVLKSISKNKKWLMNELHKEYINLNEIFYAFYTNNSIYIITKEELM